MAAREWLGMTREEKHALIKEQDARARVGMEARRAEFERQALDQPMLYDYMWSMAEAEYRDGHLSLSDSGARDIAEMIRMRRDELFRAYQVG